MNRMSLQHITCWAMSCFWCASCSFLGLLSDYVSMGIQSVFLWSIAFGEEGTASEGVRAGAGLRCGCASVPYPPVFFEKEMGFQP